MVKRQLSGLFRTPSIKRIVIKSIRRPGDPLADSNAFAKLRNKFVRRYLQRIDADSKSALSPTEPMVSPAVTRIPAETAGMAARFA